MATYVCLLNWTEQGGKNVKDTHKREAAFAKAVQKFDTRVVHSYWTLGRYDLVIILEGPNDEAMTAAALSLGALGNVHTETLRAFNGEEIDKIVARMA
jgi:uncharacterized protein with GYD domain